MAIRQRVSLTGRPYDGRNAFILDGVAFDIGTRVIKWWEDGGFGQYETNRVTIKQEDNATGEVKTKIIKGKRYYTRKKGVLGIKQVFLHHSGADREDPGVMRDVLHNQRGLSVQFAHEDNGLIYQFLDGIEAAKHAGKHNQISIGTECCLWPDARKRPNYYSDANRERTGNLPHAVKEERLQGMNMKVFCFPEQQVEAVCRWAAGLWVAIGHLREDELGVDDPMSKVFDAAPLFPRVGKGGRTTQSIPRKVHKRALEHVGLIGHLHCSKRKWDPAGFPWEKAETRITELFYKFANEFRVQ